MSRNRVERCRLRVERSQPCAVALARFDGCQKHNRTPWNFAGNRDKVRSRS